MKYFILFLLFASLEAAQFNLYPQDNPQKIKKICIKARGGDTIYFNEGIYTKKFPKIKCSGKKGAPILITAKEGAKVTIRSPWIVKGEYLQISHLNFKGGGENLRYDDVIKQWWNPGKELRQNGLLIVGHHITLKDNAIGCFTASGVKFKGKSDYIQIDHNIIYNNAWWSTGGTGGLIIKTIHQIDNKKTAKIKITNNLFFGNESRIFSHVYKKGFSKLVIDEGESFLLQQKEDANKKGARNGHYSGRYLVRNNLILYNGKGTSLNKVDRVDLVRNYLYCNGTTATSVKAGGIRGKNTNYDTFINNYISSCKNKMAVSVIGKHNTFKNNIVKSKIQKPIPGVKIVDRVFTDPKHLDFNPEANKLLRSFQPLLKRYDIKIKPTGYIVDTEKQIEDIIRLIPKKKGIVIKRVEDKIIIKNIDNRGIKDLGRSFVLKLK